MQKKNAESSRSIKGCMFSLFVFMLTLIFLPFAILSFAVSVDGSVGWFVGGLSASFFGLLLQIFRVGSRPLEKWALRNRYLVSITVGLIMGGLITAVSTQMIGAIVGGMLATFWGYWLLPAINWLQTYFDKHPSIKNIVSMIVVAILVSFEMYQIFRSDFPNLDAKFIVGYSVGATLLLFLFGWLMAEIWWLQAIVEGTVVAAFSAMFYLFVNLFAKEFGWLGQLIAYFGELSIKVFLTVVFAGLFLILKRKYEDKETKQLYNFYLHT